MSAKSIVDEPELNTDDVDYSRIPIRALNTSSRLLLSSSLNPEQLITSDNGLARDYRGLAELIGFSYSEVKNFQRSNDPLNALLNAIDVMPKEKQQQQHHQKAENDRHSNIEFYSFSDLISMLEQIERFDVIDDLTPSLKTDALKFWQQKQRKIRNGAFALQTVPQSSSIHEEESPLHLTVDDAINADTSTKYDAYICYADSDYDFVKSLAAYLESPEIGLKLFIRDRDLLLGTWEYHAFTKLIEERCNRVVIILTPEFLQSPECEFQTRFATGLAIERRCRMLIPIIYKRCELPSSIKMVTKIDLVKANGIQDWVWRKIIISIRGPGTKLFLPPSDTFITQTNYLELQKPSNTQASSSQFVNHLAFSSYPVAPTAPSLTSSLNSTSLINELHSTNGSALQKSEGTASVNSTSTTTASSTTLSTGSTKSKRNWYKSLKQKITGSSYSSTETNGYQTLN
ncbi:myeloid differentiation primary response protein MyD88-like isoform X1 [Dinothrombium tinctorium]|uniref:Myeloid differentiation primary response protein MyD88-like isoform X1 n=1 Tax=Dinothrombium tinctorium TaxID=1965070 RepID=A0A3S3RUA6_9ACAR|nr:myeloid differentiation primary response protein MyD88-like isoform X1 [Dinothrombium tinctorium]RWS04770.1 myeloid differentiation primary response protein MyD88-like isoform X1 [Dinothrombium tinctorium]RWS04832.1 myeloid differentiation primary response protein MyD88-like isoform X1 [Dinothrombium tinctorium]